MTQATPGARQAPTPPGPLRLADLFDLAAESPLLVSRLEAIHLAARKVLGDNLAAGDLDGERLDRVRSSVLRQLADAEALRDRLLGRPGGTLALERLGALHAYLESALQETDCQRLALARRH